MNIDARISFDDAQSVRDLRARTPSSQERAEGSPGTPTERPLAGGVVASSRGQNGREEPENDDPQQDLRRRQAADQLSRLLRLPENMRLDIHADQEDVRFLVRERSTGDLIREIPEAERQGLLDKLREHQGALIDRSF